MTNTQTNKRNIQKGEAKQHIKFEKELITRNWK